MKYCNQCGNEIKNSSKFCNKCGNRIVKTKDLNDVKDNIKNAEYSQTNKENTEAESNKFDIDKTALINIDDIKLYDNLENNTLEDDIDEDFLQNYDSIENTVDEVDIKPKSKKKKYIIISITIAIILATSSFLYFSKDSILYKYYFNKANSATSTFDKLTYYNNALQYNKNDDIINLVYDTLKEDSSFIDEISKLSNLNTDDTNELIYKLCIFYANKNFYNENYATCFNYLKLAEEHGYNIKEYKNYNELKNKLENTEEENLSSSENIYSFENTEPVTKLPQNIYDYDGDYIAPYSDFTYIDKSDLYKYNKSTLALMRNEIYARHGYIFKTEPYKSYFNSKSWYTPDSSFKGADTELNEYEIKNVRTIKSVEDSK